MRLKAVFIAVLYSSRLSIQSLGLIAKFIYKKRRAKSIFGKTLVRHGISQEAAQELAKCYPNPNPISEILSLVNMRRKR